MRTHRRETLKTLLALFLFELFFVASAFGADWGQAPGTTPPAQQQQPGWGQQQSGQTPPTAPETCPKLSFTTSPFLPNAAANENYQFQFQTTGGTPPITYTLHPDGFGQHFTSHPELRKKITLSTSGLLTFSNFPEGKYDFNVVATDSCQPQNQQVVNKFFLTVKPLTSHGGADNIKGNMR